jgi:hypothetical protein
MTQETTASDSEQDLIVRLLTTALQGGVETWNALPALATAFDNIESQQVKSVLRTLAQLGIDLPALAALNQRKAAVFPVTHVTHYKGGHYIVLGDGVHTETSLPLTIYCKDGGAAWYLRPVWMFQGFVDRLDCKRFLPRTMRRLIDPPGPV